MCIIERDSNPKPRISIFPRVRIDLYSVASTVIRR
jgi:hypothetical protein